MKDILAYFPEHHDEMLDELKEFLRIPSISTGTENKKDIAKTATFIEAQLKQAGLKKVKKYPTKGNPVVYGEWLGAKDAPTILIYGHYDVQPVEPLDLWKSDPFEPEIRDGKLFGRGSADDKGQVFIYFKVIEAFLKTKGALPVNVKVIVEGEEEIGSPSLSEFLKKNTKLLKSDVILISDTHMMGLKQPSITYGLRGLTYLEVGVKSANTDMHSGTFGGAVANPIQVLSEMLVKCKSPRTGKVLIPGFYDEVVPLSKKERAELAKLPHNDKKYAKEIGATEVFGEAKYTTVERTGSRPTFEINGIWGGHTGDGVKTVLPAEAHAKVSMRLVANQNPDTIAKLFKDYIKSITPSYVKSTVKLYENNGFPSLAPIDSPGMVAAAKAIKAVYKKEPFFTREGGSIPVVADMQNILQVEPVLLGFGLPDDNLHAPNEKMDIKQITNGYATVTNFFYQYAEIMKK